MYKRIFFVVTLLLLIGTLPVLAQEVVKSTQVEMADALRADGKIYVVVLVVMIVFTFLSIYLLLTDRQVKKLEKEVKDLKRSK